MAGRIPLFNAPHLPPPPMPPENIVTEQDRQAQVQYEQWLNHQHQVVANQLKYYETQVNKLRKIRKSLNSKKRQLRKSGNELTEADALELQRISSEQAVLQKQLEVSRKQHRQHQMLIEEYHIKLKQQQQQRPLGQHLGPTNLQPPAQQSPLGPPASSPVPHPSTNPQSPLMSSSPSPLHSPVGGFTFQA